VALPVAIVDRVEQQAVAPWFVVLFDELPGSARRGTGGGGRVDGGDASVSAVERGHCWYFVLPGVKPRDRVYGHRGAVVLDPESGSR
jgi:hypothetical protein